MSLPKQILLLGLLLLSFASLSQDYNYIHYTNKEGLAGNTVYGVAQDKDGFMFFATENGLSRYDGKEWKTFTVKDGLPDNEVLVIFGDSKGRVWMSCFNKALCYYFKGKIYNSANEEVIKKINLTTLITQFHEIENGDIIISTNEAIINLTHLNSVETIHKKPKKHNSKVQPIFKAEKNELDSGSLIFCNDSMIFYKDNKEKCIYSPQRDSIYSLYPVYYLSQKLLLNTFKSKAGIINSCDMLNKHRSFINTNNGSYHLFNNIEHFLPNIRIGHTYEDKEKNLWFTTLGNGVYKTLSSNIKSYVLTKIKENTNKDLLTITKNNNTIIAGASYGKLLTISNKTNSILDFQYQIKNSLNSADLNRATSSLQFNSSTSIVGFDSYLLKLQNNQPVFNYGVMPVKSVEKINDENIIVATGNRCYKVRVNYLKVVDTIWNERTTYAFYQNKQYYIGTLNGLYKIDANKKQTYLGNIHPSLKRRIVCIKSASDERLFVATADNGMVVLKDNKFVGVFNEENGLKSNSCKTIHINNNTAWIGTIKGITKIDLITNKVIATYTTSDGLPSDIINAIYYDTADSTTWVGSPEGLTYFKEKNIAGQSICNLVVENITISKTAIKVDSNNFSLKYNDNIDFQFVGISFRSGEEIIYHYKLQGLDTGYNTTTERFISYPSLPSGNYTLALYATNKFGVQSKIYNCSFYVHPPFWKTWWFTIIEVLAIVIIVWAILYRRLKQKEKEYKRIADFEVQLTNMEQLALQAQMNPHFIFNCLNSIQQFILANETEKANKYLVLFSRLIRNTLDNSEKKNITLTSEIDYLQQYLMLEHLRFGDKFSYDIAIANDIISDDVDLPAMLLQPFVENSLRHGIRQLVDKNGMLNIEFHITNNYLICTIEDNGIGRAAAEKYKSNMHIEYQSKGMQLTAKRVDLLNTNATNKISIEIMDLKDNADIATGTKVIVRIPV